jgi:hypothetical protein
MSVTASTTANNPALMPATAELMQQVLDVERRFPVLDWTVDGVHLWPLLRIDAFMREWARHYLEPTATGPWSRAEPVRRLILGPLRARELVRRDPQGADLGPERRDVLFLSDGVSFAQLDGRWVEKFCDPLRRRLELRGFSTAMWTLGHHHRQPRFSPATPIQYPLDRAKLRGEARARCGRAEMRLPGHAAVLGALRHRAMMPVALHARAAESLGARLSAASEFFTRRLLRLRPRLAMVVSYYSLEAMALIRACRGLDIPTVDLQHGVQGVLHPAYASWPRLVGGACHELLPDRFWVWSDEDAQLIASWAVGSGHAPVAGGNPWAEVWSGSADWPGADSARRRIAALRSSAGDRLIVLVSVQNGFSEAAQIDAVKALAEVAGDRARFWVRLHPGMLESREAIRRSLARTVGVEVDEATDLPLPALLQVVNVHMTYCSSVVIEAAAQGISSLLTSLVGAEMYPSQIAEGRAMLLERDATAQWEALLALSVRRARPGSNGRTTSLDEALGELVHQFGMAASDGSRS